MKDPQEEVFVEAKSLGSDCCSSDVIENDGVLRCVSCNEPCEEVFETDEEAVERYEDEIASVPMDRDQERFEESR